MTSFELVFSLFGLLLGLALAEVLGGFGTAIQLRKKIRIGWLTPLLGALVALDVTSFWMIAWDVRERVPAHYVTLMGGLLIIGLYYLIARITFPHDSDDWPDLDAYYFEHRKWVLGGAMACNLLAIVALVALGAEPLQGALTRWSMLAFMAPFETTVSTGRLFVNGQSVAATFTSAERSCVRASYPACCA